MAPSPRPQLFKLALPIFVESALHALTSTVDVLMVSTISDEAVAGLSVANQFVMVAVTLFSFVAIGGSVVITHSLGGGDKSGARNTVITATSVNFWMGLIISLFVALSVVPLTSIMQLSAELQVHAQPYLFIVGATLWLVAHNVSMSAVLRAHGHAADAMWVTLIQNILNAAGNAVLLFGLFGAPQMGIIGVAIATALSRAVAAVMLLFLLRHRTGIQLSLWQVVKLPTTGLRRILRIGLPSAGEHLCWWMAFMTITSFTARLGATELATQSYTMLIMHYVFTFSFALALANEILIGYQVGAGEFESAYKQVPRTLKAGLPFIGAALIPIALFGAEILSFFTTDLTIIAVGTQILLIGIILEPGRLVSMVMVCALRAAGDVRFPLKVGLVVMWGVWVPLSWLFGITFGWGLIGIWLAFISDIVIRGGLFLNRWKSRGWMKHAQTSRDSVTSNLVDLPE
ncbi:MAG: MATE family efflux transporter [Opitutaceae bacterium]|jgi:putative MATE family efflux protein|nr:MATE family efflux transporter [Opitutaceae bacterium]